MTLTANASPPTETPSAVPIVDWPQEGRSLGWWGMVGLIASEGTLFGLLFFVAIYLRANNHPWPPRGVADPELVRSGIRTAILVASVVPAVFAERAMRFGRMRRFRTLALSATIMGVLFLIGSTLEYLRTTKVFTPTSNAYGSAFYIITGLDAVHLAVGVVILVYVLIQSLWGRYDARGESVGVHCGFMYWYFVVVVSLSVYAVMYVSERL